MPKILMVLTNQSRYGETGHATGLWLGEATEFVDIVSKAGFDIDYVSPKGGYVPIDPRSYKYATVRDLQIYNSSKFAQAALANSKHPDEIKADEYIAIYFAGGHGAMWDFTQNLKLHKIAANIYKNNGFVTSVCHGIAGILYIKDNNGKLLVAGKKVTGFTGMEEFLSGKKYIVPFLNEKIAKQQQANFKKARAYKAFVVQDGHLITGQNPFSVRLVAEKLVKNLLGA
ncbi:type 1 glutamine amidotransferase domain-containing protein [Periweissella beninensis]|uniref:Type 1 glutamine amidotransferase domain-containing protein n=1 Tax=Periweissella beninensis TaxID=504936 RepID=A0ABT0VIU8_9LACO|nr:type 1 glutamine amidotransferase domain-containing protein [Periweissella beninensis]MBM7544254.1 putative intracellular protease/amidase [Periweissella beninensis]MCM2437758.1 type 1 glutamine amidotransferase domain-containing protein [Periweissella beninensis]MCT4396417.1 type 1 glutamine amidotransferase domain-containing protein [Periweissella beninensis]